MVLFFHNYRLTEDLENFDFEYEDEDEDTVVDETGK